MTAEDAGRAGSPASGSLGSMEAEPTAVNPERRASGSSTAKPTRVEDGKTGRVPAGRQMV